MSKYKDFDAMFSEMKSETVRVKILGEYYEVQKTIPAYLMLELSRKADDETLSDKMLFRLADAVFGEAVVDKWAKTPGFTVEKLMAIIRWVWNLVTGGDTGEMIEMTEDDMGAENDEKN